MSRHSDAGAIAGLCFLACIAIVALALIGHVIHPHLPALRDFLLQTLTPEFGAGVVFALASIGVATLVWAAENYIRNRRRH